MQITGFPEVIGKQNEKSSLSDTFLIDRPPTSDPAGTGRFI